MTSPIKHTPTPWFITGHGDIAEAAGGELVIRGEFDSRIEPEGKGFNDGFGHAKGNKRFVVRACSTHYELVAALRGLLGWIESRQEDGRPYWIDNDSKVWERAEAALAEAEGKA